MSGRNEDTTKQNRDRLLFTIFLLSDNYLQLCYLKQITTQRIKLIIARRVKLIFVQRDEWLKPNEGTRGQSNSTVTSFISLSGRK